MSEPYLRVQNLRKVYPGVVALDNASVDFYPGEVHALLGENGAGKSTLCKLIAGAETPDGGSVVVNGKAHRGFTPVSAKEAGISMVYQELNLIPTLTVYENFFLGKEKGNGLFLDRGGMIAETRKALEAFGVEIDPEERVSKLSVAYQQLVEICKVVYENAKVIILDEPTAPLTNDEVTNLFSIIREMKARGIVIIYISHRLEELYELSEKVTVMRDGKVVATLMTAESTKSQLIRLMVARDIGESFPAKEARAGEVIMTVEHLVTDKLKDVSFSLRAGEVLGLAGLVGSGRTEILRALFAADERRGGRVIIRGKQRNLTSPAAAINAGIGLISEDRKRDGLLMKMSIAANISIVILKRLCSRLSFVSADRERSIADDSIQRLGIRAPSQKQLAKNLSGGNQQKVVIAKWLNADASILLMDEPTRGIDVGTKQEIYSLIDTFRKEGRAVLMVSSDLPELIGMSDRVLVMYEGAVQGELKGEAITQERILTLASGIQNER